MSLKSKNPLPASSSEKLKLNRPRLNQKSTPNFDLLLDLAKLGYKKIVGLDEVGRGALAGPLVVGAVEITINIPGVNDSKVLSQSQRESFAELIQRHAVQIKFGEASNTEIDQLGLTAALDLAYARALEDIEADLLLTDFIKLPDRKHLRAIKGDQLFYSVAAASIVAKVYRDNKMRQLHQDFSDFDWHKNVGYGTKRHLDGIKKYGPTPHHRQSFL